MFSQPSAYLARARQHSSNRSTVISVESLGASHETEKIDVEQKRQELDTLDQETWEALELYTIITVVNMLSLLPRLGLQVHHKTVFT